MGDHDDLPLEPRSADTKIREQGERETWIGADPLLRFASPPNAGDFFGNFHLEKFLGQGSSGCVFRALDSKTNRRCALKFVCNDPAVNLVRTKLGFRRMMRVEHPNLARADQIYCRGNQIALAMEEIRGNTFANSLKQLRNRPIDEACHELFQLMRDYASALAAIHGHCFIHRDIKPQNLMIDEQGRGRIIDYGLVGTFDADLNPSGLRNYVIGTQGYLAPETLSKQFYLPAGDIYALGRVMVSALRVVTGRSPVELDSRDPDGEVVAAQEALGEIEDSVPSELRDACFEMIQSSPGDRPTASQIARLGLKNSAIVAWPDRKAMHGRDNEYTRICDWLRSIYSGKKGRLHLYGPSGIGKTRLIDEIEDHLQSKPFGQVFHARCRPREDHPFHAFDQIVDEIANRYMKNDLQRSRVDPVSAAILYSVFPALKSVVAVNMDLPAAGMKSVRLDALEAASRLSVELRKNGPLILIIDDAQWADPDSVAVLDRLRDAPGSSLGMITVSRTKSGIHQRDADVCVELKPLSTDASIALLSESADRWSAKIDLLDLKKLVELVEGNPFRLSELSQEFRPGGLLSMPEQCANLADSILKGEPLHWLCQQRVERLSVEARRILPLILVAGRPVSLEQLDVLSELGTHVDAPVSELVRASLVTDEAIGSECISVTHDGFADRLISVLQPSELKKAHQDWAQWLLQQDQPHLVAARAAGHLFDADEPSRAVSSAITAAKQSERIYAYRDAGRWYDRVLPLVSGAERVQGLRDAARCFEMADLPVEAAQHYQELAKFVDVDERTECIVTAIGLLIRSGRFKLVRHELRELTRELKLPRPKHRFLAQASVLLQLIRLEIEKRRQRKEMRKAARAKKSLVAKSMTVREQQRLTLCLELARPLSLFDNLHASELNLFAARLSHLGSDVRAQLYVAIGSAVFGCYGKGASRTNSETLLHDLLPRVVAFGDDRTLGDYWAASSFTQMFACRWHLISERVEQSLAFYEKTQCSHGFQVSHTQSNSVWAQWHLGCWDDMADLHDSVLSESIQRNDLIQTLHASLGLIATVWLSRNQPDELLRAQKQCAEILSKKVGIQLFDHQDWINSMLYVIYCDDWQIASQYLKSYPKLRNRSPVKNLQVFRVMYLYFGALVSLHRMRLQDGDDAERTAKRFIDGLRSEQLDYTTIVADLFEGLFLEMSSKPEHARNRLRAAAQMASKCHLRPIHLAANDALERIETGIAGESLQDRMRKQGIVKPSRFEQLYTVRIKKSPNLYL